MKRVLAGVALVAGAVALAGCMPGSPQVGRALYSENCLACHGPAGKGDGPAAAGLPVAVPDLSTLTARNGGTFPQVRVMGVIDGWHRRGNHSSMMPIFGEDMAEGDLVMVETDPGQMTPTPAALVALAAYLERLQE